MLMLWGCSTGEEQIACWLNPEHPLQFEMFWWPGKQEGTLYTHGSKQASFGVLLHNVSDEPVELSWLTLHGVPRWKKKGLSWPPSFLIAPHGQLFLIPAQQELSWSLPTLEMAPPWYMSWRQGAIAFEHCHAPLAKISYQQEQTGPVHRVFRPFKPVWLRLFRPSSASLPVESEPTDAHPIQCMANQSSGDKLCWQRGSSLQQLTQMLPTLGQQPNNLLQAEQDLRVEQQQESLSIHPWTPPKVWLTEVLADGHGADRGEEWIELYIDGVWSEQEGLWLEQWVGPSRRRWWIEPAWLLERSEQFLWLVPAVRQGGLLECIGSQPHRSPHALGGRLFANGPCTWRLRRVAGDILDSWHVPQSIPGIAWQRCWGLEDQDATLADTSWYCHNGDTPRFLGTPGGANPNCSLP